MTILKPSAEYNRRAAIIEGLRAGRSADGNNLVLGKKAQQEPPQSLKELKR